MEVEAMTEEEHLDDDVQPMAQWVRTQAALRQDAASGCLDEEALAAFVSGAGAGRAEALAHLTACARCRHAVAMLSRLVTDERIVSEVRLARGAAWPRRVRWTVGVAAAAAIAVLLLRPSRTDDLVLPGSELREPPITVVGGPALIAPRGRVAAVTILTWSHVPRAARYRLRLYDSVGTAVWENETTDTTVTVASAIPLASGATYFWRVEAKTGRNRWVASELAQFTLAHSGP
ncbi:MAG: hypothetical protein AUI08_06730 [Gemmatimonadetes bacterium 13_2_20CM_2_65_7]|nr:MAG: hypothetical protein AUI08_06730 [Gemmatimonadetes bacterium 13_2_20CM_2_65_7]